ncbi:uncharacterized protein LOC142802641 [Rhipicephalus microplus]|uniref:uncharacterized protein LOC142802641 n=1 Tax=Rhipicephalus microplus TaxID=6941 RepID=UPI003F6C7E09
MLVKLFESKFVGKEGLQYLIAWTFYRQLFKFTNPIWFLEGRRSSDACIKLVKDVMKQPITSHVFQSDDAHDNLMNAGEAEKLAPGSNAEGPDAAVQATGEETADATTQDGKDSTKESEELVATGGQQDIQESMEEDMGPYPDVLPERLFPTWIKYVSLNAHLAWRDQKTTRYDESAVNAYFSPGEHAVFIPTAIMRRPFLYMYGPIGLNYGALGTTSDLVNWMRSLKLDLLDRHTLATVNPVEMMVRGSLDLGVEAVISLTFYGRAFVLGKRLMEMDYSKQQSMWRSENHGLNDYVLFLAEFGATSYSAYDLASKLRGYENQLDDISRATYTSEQTTEFVFELSKRTSPYVSKDDWDTFLYKYTNNTYTVDDNIFYRPYLATMIVKLFESTHVGKEGLQYLVAWTFYRQLFELTDPTWFLRGRSANDACYEHVKKVLKLAITSHHFQSVVPPRMLYQTKRMTSRIRSSFEEALQSSSWLTPEIRATSINKLINITVYTGSPGRRLDPDYVEELYKSFPDVPLDRLFPTWIRYLSLSTHLAWRDQKTMLYDETMVNAFFSPIEDAVFITTAIMHRPFLYLYGPIGLNYGGLGTVVSYPGS